MLIRLNPVWKHILIHFHVRERFWIQMAEMIRHTTPGFDRPQKNKN